VISVCLVARCIALSIGVFFDWHRAVNANGYAETWFARWYFTVPYYLIGEWIPNLLVLIVLRGQRLSAAEQDPLLVQVYDSADEA